MKNPVGHPITGCLGVATLALLLLATPALAQGPGRGGRGGPPPTPRAQAPMDLTGQWVSVISEDWRWRMVTPQKGDYASLPLNAEARKIADSWDLQKDVDAGEQCKAFGAAAIMRMPTRVRISWEDDRTLKLETDAGQQTRTFHFAGGPGAPATTDAASAERSWQGVSVAEWNKTPVSRGLGFGGARGVAGGNLKVTTTNLRPGYLRKNGVPYSQNARVTEYFNRHEGPEGTWFTVTTIVEDPQYLNQPLVWSSSFKQEEDQSKWNPTPCVIDPPR
ncbi:MAG: hypothetical protein AB7P99_03685 [Vicinamibacterales bacterium]